MGKDAAAAERYFVNIAVPCRFCPFAAVFARYGKMTAQ